MGTNQTADTNVTDPTQTHPPHPNPNPNPNPNGGRGGREMATWRCHDSVMSCHKSSWDVTSVHDFIFMSCHDNGHDQAMTTSSRMVANNCNDGVALSRVVMSC